MHLSVCMYSRACIKWVQNCAGSFQKRLQQGGGAQSYPRQLLGIEMCAHVELACDVCEACVCEFCV